MRTTDPGDAARIELLLAELRLPAIKLVWASLAAQADKQGWPAGRFLAALAEHEIAERSRRRLERHLAEARWSARPKSWRLPPAMRGSTTAPIYCCLVRRAGARAISRQRSASLLSRTAGACCSRAPPISSAAA